MPELEVSSGSFLSQIVALDLTIRPPRKSPKSRQGTSADRLRLRLSRYELVPWTPILRGPQLGKLGGYRKGAGGQGIGSRSMTAAAECPVTFGARSSWMGSRLLGWWGSSAAQGDGVS